MRLVAGFGFLLLLSASCTRPNPAYCDDSSACANGTTCDVSTHTCVSNGVDGSTACSTNSECTDAAQPVCGSDGACRACALDDECESGVCRDDGACESEDNVLYVTASGPSAGQCTKSTPCDLFYARSLLTPSRSSIRLANGTYAFSSVFGVTPPLTTATVVGGRGALVQRMSTGPSFEVRGGASLALRGFSLTRGVACSMSTLVVKGLAFDAPTETRSWLVLQTCEASVTSSELTNSTSHGIDAMNGGTLDVTDTKITRGSGNGINSTGYLSITRSFIESNTGVGVLASTQVATVTRSWIAENRAGGLGILGGRFEVTNNFVTRNGTEGPGSMFGGMRLQSQLSGNRVDHNTIVRNDTPPDTMYAGGLYCDAAGTAANNLIANNFTGNEQFPNAQVAGNCVATGSLIAVSDAEFHLVRSMAQPFDYRIADEQSIAVDAGSTLSMPLSEDFDGQPRSDGKPDVGADELEQ